MKFPLISINSRRRIIVCHHFFTEHCKLTSLKTFLMSELSFSLHYVCVTLSLSHSRWCHTDVLTYKVYIKIFIISKYQPLKIVTKSEADIRRRQQLLLDQAFRILSILIYSSGISKWSDMFVLSVRCERLALLSFFFIRNGLPLDLHLRSKA